MTTKQTATIGKSPDGDIVGLLVEYKNNQLKIDINDLTLEQIEADYHAGEKSAGLALTFETILFAAIKVAESRMEKNGNYGPIHQRLLDCLSIHQGDLEKKTYDNAIETEVL